MPTPIWPTSLPQSPLIEGYSNIPQDSVMRSPMDGYTKQRNKYTAVMSDVTESYLMSQVQYAVFKDFFRSTLKNGSTDFIKNNPETGLGATYRMSGTYSPSFNGVTFKVKLKMEMVP